MKITQIQCHIVMQATVCFRKTTTLWANTKTGTELYPKENKEIIFNNLELFSTVQ